MAAISIAHLQAAGEDGAMGSSEGVREEGLQRADTGASRVETRKGAASSNLLLSLYPRLITPAAAPAHSTTFHTPSHARRYP